MNIASRTDMVALPGVPAAVDASTVIDQMVRRASSVGFESWWRRAESVGFCAHPIHLIGTDECGRDRVVWARCNNRRTQVCPSCSDLYARDTWQLVHAGTAGGHHGIPTTVAHRPQVFVTLTAPSYGPVHTTTAGRSGKPDVCRARDRLGDHIRCEHGKPLWCNATHEVGDEQAGQPLCPECYDYVGHVLFTWYLPELWRRLTIALRRALRTQLTAAGADTDTVRVSFVKVVELQARLIPHIHALIRLDPPEPTSEDEKWQAPATAPELATVVQRAARTVTLTVDDPSSDVATRVIRFGSQVDTRPITQQPSADSITAEEDSSPQVSGRKVARYLAKYVTKSLADIGVSARRISAEAIPDLDVSDHVRAILTTIAELADQGLNGIGRWLHTLGYRGHITSKSRRYSTTMSALRARRATWTREKHSKSSAQKHHPGSESTGADDLVFWEFDPAGHTSLGDRTLIISAAQLSINQRRTAREHLQQKVQISQGWRGDG